MTAPFISISDSPRVLSPFRGGGIEYLNSYTGWSFYTPVRASHATQVEG